MSFFGGGTDLPVFFEQEDGFAISATINKYIHLTFNERFDSCFRLSYRKNEVADSIADIEHPIIRTVLSRHFKQKGPRGLEVISMTDVPSGTGLGSSSSFTVGMLNGVFRVNGEKASAEKLAEEACRIELDDLGEPIGVQDQYAAAFGGFNGLTFKAGRKVEVRPIGCTHASLEELERSIMLMFTGVVRSASEIMREQRDNSKSKWAELQLMKKLALDLKTAIEDGSGYKKVGHILRDGWQIKRTMASGITNTQIDEWFDRGIKAGAFGGKLMGAGGGGFLLFICPPDRQQDVENELKELRRLHVSFEPQGSRVVFEG